MMRVVFLDIDGVLNSEAYLLGLPKDEANQVIAAYAVDWALRLDPVNVRRLERLFVQTGAEVVVSSDWRRYHTAPRIQEFLARRGAPSVYIIDRCPDGDRGPSILDWLRWNREKRAFGPVSSWIALDDCREMGEAEPRTVRTDPAVGLTDADVDRAIAMLERTDA